MAPLAVDLTDRISELESELAHDPSPGVFAPLAEAYRLSGSVENALATARSGVDAYPDHLGIRIVLARAIADSDEPAGALSAYEEVLARDAGNLEARAYLDAAAAAEEKAAAARAAAEAEEKAAEAERQASEARAAAATQSQKEVEPPPADRAWSPNVDGGSETPFQTGAGSLSEELAHLADLFVPSGTDSGTPSLGPSSIATLTLAEIYSRQGLYGKAAEVCERILERDPGNERARSALEEYQKPPGFRVAAPCLRDGVRNRSRLLQDMASRDEAAPLEEPIEMHVPAIESHARSPGRA